MIYTVTLNPALDKTVEIPGMALDTVNRVTSMRTDPGGKGINVSKVIAKLGGESCAVGILGGESGRTLLAALEREGLRTHFRFVEGQTRTNLKIIDRALHTNTDINEPGLTVSPADHQERQSGRGARRFRHGNARRRGREYRGRGRSR